MMSVTSYTFYTYSQATADDQAHWLHGHTTVQFFDSLEAARQEIVKLHEDLSQDLDLTWRPLYLEKIETRAVTKHLLLSLLNRNMEALIERHMIVDTISSFSSSALSGHN
ncbi:MULTISPECIES: hypothetical protein [Agrobacterium tumefaciens complex]|uniref:Uncharacterized protein n=3 Tax=Rhizobiaceae TaxID=82115 RepID=A0A2Z2PG23_AGRTU|nr:MULTISPECIES: hypothetical protein [Agrobacterium tumefaciens complex]ASK41097.1 hypothetical protein [Rhizobium rhizogenes]ASK41260.1 hypothetical protein [Agrobacterium tumefaciens]ASK44478.1 hypothetical protein [Agrobacterium tumefaciens]MDJ1637877.1 hypothetical protein [Rhizobium rhizogenes]NTI46436.1 hypothetical protein [Rhizobium rhizogenes]